MSEVPAPSADDYRVLGRRLSNWGRWGVEDELGTLNLIGDAERVRAAGLIRTGTQIALGLPLGAEGPQGPYSERDNLVHVMTRLGDTVPSASGYVFTDDLVVMYPQGSTQIDGLAHVGYDGRLYNDHPLSTVTRSGAQQLGIEAMIAGIQGRGVLLDIPRFRQTDALPADAAISPDDLEACAQSQDVQIGRGDILLVRTGWMATYLRDGDGQRYLTHEPGLTLACATWLQDRDIAFLASDNYGVEIVPAEDPSVDFPLHSVLIRDMGMPLGEMFVLDELARACADSQRWEFFFSCLPLPIVGGVGSPIAPVAIL
jgi:kynurenine formamidase